ncbi:MAG: autotransporter outer membrane beta-barrel domain-containing protein, partial [Pseudoxanthomonas suwonensis]|nr:autotransporter outer membrane beta-barrel domain-containing protein [Pseudoxanthomonas suwonensis]
MTRRYTQPAPMNGLAGLSYPVVPPPAPVPTSPRGRLRRHALALAIVAATGGLVLMPQTSLAAQCARADSDGGKTVRFDRPAGVGPGTRYRYPDPSGEFDSKDHNRVEVGNCYVPIGSTAVTTADAITVDVNVTDLYGNGNQSVGGTNPRDVFVGSIDLRERTVTDPNARNVITIKGINRYGNIFGPGGVAPTTLNLEGMRIDGLYVVSASDDDVIRNGDIINIREGADIRTYVYAGGGNDTLNLEGGYAREVYGDNRNGFDAATLEDPANSFNDVFNIRDGTYIGVNGDSGSDRSGYAAGNDVFNLHGGTITTLEGDGGNDTFNFLGPITVRDAFGDAGDDLFVLESSVDPTLLWNIAGDDGSDYPATGNGGDRIQIKGLVLRASSDRNTRPDANQNNVTSIRAMNVVELLDGTQLTMYDNAEGSDAMSSFRLGRPTGDPEDDKLLIDATSALIHLGKYTQGSTESSRDASINYNVQNLGTIDLGQDAPGTRMTIRGNYIGGGRLLMSTYLGDDSSESDVLILLGNASGSTVLDIKPVAGSPGGQTVEGITLVDIDPTKAIAADAFVLAAPITTENGLWQYRLARNATTQDFVLTSGVAP